MSIYLCQRFPCQVCVKGWVFFKVFSQNNSTFLRASFALNFSTAKFKTKQKPTSSSQYSGDLLQKAAVLVLLEEGRGTGKKKNPLLLRWTLCNLSEKSVPIWSIHKALGKNPSQLSFTRACQRPARARRLHSLVSS